MKTEKDFFYPADNIAIYYEKYTPENTKEVVLVVSHGAAVHSGFYYEIKDIAKFMNVTLYLYDRRGHGKTPTVLGSLEDDASDFAFLIKKISNDCPKSKIIGIGESLGGILLLDLLEKNALNLNAVILLSPEIKLQPLWKRIKSYQQIGRFIFTLLLGLITFQFKILLPLPFSPSDLVRGSDCTRIILNDKYFRKKLPFDYLLNSVRLGNKVLKLANRITVPSLIIHGEGDLLVNPRGSVELFNNLGSKKKRLMMISKAYHGLLCDPETENVKSLIKQWIQENFDI